MRVCAEAWRHFVTWGVPFAVLTLQTTMPLLIRYSQRRATGGKLGAAPYNPASVTLLAEIAKCVVGLILYTVALEHRRGPGEEGKKRILLVEAARLFASATWRLRCVGSERD